MKLFIIKLWSLITSIFVYIFTLEQIVNIYKITESIIKKNKDI